MTKALAQLQQQFASCLTMRGEDPPGAVKGDDKAGARERMDLYAGAYVSRLAEVMGEDFPGVWGMVGDDQFWQLCQAYIGEHPSVYPSIRWFGSHLVEFLRQNSPYSDYSQISEMAAFEWAQGLVFDAAGGESLDMETFSRILPEAWAGLTFEFTPAMQRLDLGWNIPELWSALNKGDDPLPELQQGAYPSAWLLWRQQLIPGWRYLDVDEAWALDRAREGMNFGNICEGLLEWVDEFNAPLRAAGFLRTWVGHGLVIGVDQGGLGAVLPDSSP